MLDKLKEKNRFYTTLLLISMSIYCFVFSIFRFYISETKYFLFLNWNLFLAFVPWVFTTALILFSKLQKNKLLLLFIILIWILFFPNAPYILTDLFHLKSRANIPLWFDLSLILSFAWTGLFFGVISLMDLEVVLKNYLNSTILKITIIFFLFIGAFGIYLGRFLRFNSWDIVREPTNLLYNSIDVFFNPEKSPKAIGVTFTLGILLNMIYWMIRSLQKR